MDVGLLFVTLLLVLEAELKSSKPCKFEYRYNCRYWNSCRVSLYCNKAIECDERTTINISEVKYGINYYYYISNYCPLACDSGLTYSSYYTRELMTFCNKKQICDLRQWNTNAYWKLHVIYDCQAHNYEITTRIASPSVETTPFRYTTTIDTTAVQFPTESTNTRQVSTTRPQPPPQTTVSINGLSTVAEFTKDENNSPDQFPMPAVAASVTVGIIVLVIVLSVVVCMKRRRKTKTSNQPDETTLQMQIVANNSYGFSPPSVNSEDQQETDGHASVDITLQKANHASDGTSEQEDVYLNADKVVNTDINDEYNTLNTHFAPFLMDPNNDHIPKCSHSTVDETYSHITDAAKAMPDATYSHLKDTKSAASRNAKSNQNNSDNVYNHINTKSVEENVNNNSQTSFNRSISSHLGDNKAAEDDYDHTSWKQTKTDNSKSKNSNNKAVGKFKTNNINKRARDEYAVVKKRSDNVESSAGHNYFVLEKHFFEHK